MLNTDADGELLVPGDSSKNQSRSLVSVICPVHNDAESVPLFFQRLHAAIAPMRASYDFELIFMNNDFTDGSLEEMERIRRDHSWVYIISLSRNFGYQASLTSGLWNAAGDAIVFIDVDCEDPPELIPQMLAKRAEGFDVVYGLRASRPENAVMVFARKLFYRLTKTVADSDFILDMAEFSLISKRVRAVCLRNGSTYPFIRNEIAYAGFRRFGIAYRRGSRAAGKSHYNLVRMFQFAVAGFLSASTFPLRLNVYLGIPLCTMNVVVAFWWLWRSIDLLPLILANLTVIVIAAGSISLFLARVYKDGVRRTLFVIDASRTYLPRTPLDDHGLPVGDPGTARLESPHRC